MTSPARHLVAAAILWSTALCSVPAGAVDLTVLAEDVDPWAFEHAGKPSGIMIEAIDAASRQAGLSTQIELSPLARAIARAESQPGVCALPITRPAETKPAAIWVGPVAKNIWQFFAPADSAITLASLDEAKRYRIGVHKGDAIDEFLSARGGFTLDGTADDALNAQKLVAGRFDLWADGLAALTTARLHHVAIKPVFTFREVDLGLLCNRQSPNRAIERFQAALDALLRDGSLDQIRHRFIVAVSE